MEADCSTTTPAQASKSSGTKHFLLKVDSSQVSKTEPIRESKPSRIPLRGTTTELGRRGKGEDNHRSVKSILKDSTKGGTERGAKTKSVEIALNKMEVVTHPSVAQDAELEIGNLPDAAETAPNQALIGKTHESDSDSDETISTISSPSNYFSGPASSELLSQPRTSPLKHLSASKLPTHSVSPASLAPGSLRMMDSGYYDTNTSKSESEVATAARKSPLSVEQWKSSSLGSAPAKYSPVVSSPVKSSPVRYSPVKSSSVKSSPFRTPVYGSRQQQLQQLEGASSRTFEEEVVEDFRVPPQDSHEYEDTRLLIAALQAKCMAQEEEILSLRAERIKEAVGAQMTSLSSLLGQQEDLQTSVHRLTRDVGQKNSTIAHLEGKISYLESQSPRSRSSARDKDVSSPNVKYIPGRWTAYRAESKKYSEEMRLISEALESEGYGPSSVSSDEVIRHLWWQKENLRKSEGRAGGVASGDTDKLSKQFEEYQERLSGLEEELCTCRDNLELRNDIANETESVLKRQIEDVLISKQELDSKMSTLKGKMAAFEQDNVLLRDKSNQLRLEILEFSTKAAKQTRDLAVLRRENAALVSDIDALQTDKKKAASEVSSLKERVEEVEYEGGKLKNNNTSLHQELLQTKKNLGEVLAELTSTAAQASEYRSDCQGLREKVATVEEERQKREKWVQDIQEDASSLRSQLRAREAALSDLSDKERKMAAELEGKNKKVTKLQHDISVTEDKLSAAQKELGTTANELQEKDNKVWELTRAGSLQGDEVADLQSALERLKLDKGQLEREAGELNSEVARAKSGAFELEQQLAGERDEANTLRGKNERLAARLSSVEGERATLSQELAKEKQTLSSSKDRTDRLERELETCQKKHQREVEVQSGKCNQLVTRLSEAQKVCDLVGGENQELQKQLEDLEHKLVDSHRQLKKSEESYIHITEGLQQQLATVTEEYEHCQTTAEAAGLELTRKANGYEAKVLTLGAELRQRDSAIDAMSSESADLQDKMAALLEELQQLSHSKGEMEKKMKEDSAELSHTVRRTEEEVEIQKQCVVNLKEQLEVSHAAAQNLQLRLSHSEEEVLALASLARDNEDRVLVVEAEREDLDLHWNRINQELKEEKLSHQEDVLSLEERLEAAQQLHQTERGAWEEARGAHKQQTQTLRDDLHAVQQQLGGVRRELSGAVSDLGRERARHQEQIGQHRAEGRRGLEEREELRKEMKQEAMKLLMAENKVKQLELTLQANTQAKSKLREEIQYVQHSKTQLELDLESEKEKVSGLTKARSQLEGRLEREAGQAEQLAQDVGGLESRLRRAEQAAAEEKEARETALKNQLKEHYDSRSRYHEEKKALKEKVKQLNRDYDTLRLQCHQLQSNVTTLESSHSILASDKLQVAEELTRKEEVVLHLREDIRLLEFRNSDFDSQVSQLKRELVVLQRVHQEFEEYKKRLDSAAKAEMQRILSEVTVHMEQQYTAHRNLDKLRIENEGLSLRHKDRKIDKLKSDLRRSQLHERHDQLQLESLEMEASMLRSQKKDLDRSRKKLESRLDKVNSTLTHSLQEATARNESLTARVAPPSSYGNHTPLSRQLSSSFLSDTLDTHAS